MKEWLKTLSKSKANDINGWVKHNILMLAKLNSLTLSFFIIIFSVISFLYELNTVLLTATEEQKLLLTVTEQEKALLLSTATKKILSTATGIRIKTQKKLG